MNTQHQAAASSAADENRLLEKLALLADRENQAALEFLLQLAEVDRQKPYLSAGYSSTFDYLTRKLRYSEPAANRRIACARAIREFPSLAEELRSRALSLTTLSMAAGILNPKNLEEVLSAVRHRSRREVEEFLAGQRPRTSAPREEIQPLCIVGGLAEGEGAGGGIFDALERKLSMIPAAAGEGRPQAAGSRTDDWMQEPGCEPMRERRYALKFTINAETQAKLEEAKALLSGKYPCGVKLEDVFEEALEKLLEHRSPKRRLARREARAAASKEERGHAGARKGRARQAAENRDQAGGTAEHRPVESRHIPAAVRDAVYVRDGGCCGFVSADGVRCGERHDLEYHHIEPFARGGASRVDNLKLVCRRHNGHEARRAYGAWFMEGKAGLREMEGAAG